VNKQADRVYKSSLSDPFLINQHQA
jgi:hypothetical protein